MKEIACDMITLKETARQFRKEILETLTAAGSGHPGGSLSAVEILISLYYCRMNLRPDDPGWEERDRFVMSKGHASPVMYVTLANRGYFPKEELLRYRKLGSILQGHVSTIVPGIEFSSGELGQGLSYANGIALSAKLAKKNFKVYCLLGDGEIQEGQVWEAAMTAAHHKLDNMCAIIDANTVQENGPVSEIKNEEPLAAKWKSFNWNVIEVDGHDIAQLLQAYDVFCSTQGVPTVIIARTVKGKGVSYMENQAKWHGKAPNQAELETALKELGF
ncbi:MAG: transketolase [Endomicrobiales bacterium]|jgi:transketolase